MSDRQRLAEQIAATAVVDAPATPSWDDLYPYGWRDVCQHLPNGESIWTRIPLTLEDVLHPEEDDILMPTDEHERIRNYLFMILSHLLADDLTAVLLSDTNVAWDVPGIKPHRPDIAVIFNVRARKTWSTFDVKQEGVRPALLIEITSPKTRTVDLDNKFKEYAQVGVPYYVIIDIQQSKGRVIRELKGYHLTPQGYAPMLLNQRGWLWLEPVGVWLVIDGVNVVLYDKAGNYIENYDEVARARKQAETRATELEARLRQLEEELRRQRGE
jgi:Uma2 family endonuclease